MSETDTCENCGEDTENEALRLCNACYPCPADSSPAALQLELRIGQREVTGLRAERDALQARVAELERSYSRACDSLDLACAELEIQRERANTLERGLTVARKWAAAWKNCAPRAREYKRLWENEYEKSNSLEKRVADLVHALDEETQRCVKAEKRVEELEEEVTQHYRSFDGHVYVRNDEYSNLCRSRVERDAAIAVLKRVEWGGNPDMSFYMQCPACRGFHPNHSDSLSLRGHLIGRAPDCALAACLKCEL